MQRQEALASPERLVLQSGVQGRHTGLLPFCHNKRRVLLIYGRLSKDSWDQMAFSSSSSASSTSSPRRSKDEMPGLKRNSVTDSSLNAPRLSCCPPSRVWLSLYLIGGSEKLISLLYCCIIQEFSSSFLKSLFFAFGSKGPLSKRSVLAGAFGMERRAAERAAGRKAGQPSLWSPGPIPALLLIHGVVSAEQPTPLGIWGFPPPHQWGGRTGSAFLKACPPEHYLSRCFLKKWFCGLK